MGIGQKLWFTFGIMALCFATSIAITWAFARQAGVGIQQITIETLPLNNLSKDAFTTFKLMVAQYEQAGLLESAEGLDQANASAQEFDRQLAQLMDSPLSHTLEDAGQHWRRFHQQAPRLYRSWVVESDYSQEVVAAIDALRREEIPEIESHLAAFAQASRDAVQHEMQGINQRNNLINRINMIMLAVVGLLILAMIFTINGVRRSLAASWAALDQNQRDLNLLAENLASASRDNLDQANSVVEAAQSMQVSVTQMASTVEEMSQNVNSISSASEQLSLNMKHIAGSVAEMNKSMLGVDRQAHEGAMVAGEGTTKATATNQVMTTLGSAALAIGGVTNLIKRIADQTNLLALNATIEAASAGDAGKGFAVVAAEIKELASQSAHAADDIAARIRGIQSGSEEAVQATAAILKIINTINQSARTITSAMSEQSETANAITGNISESTRGVEDIAEAISQLASGSTQASDNASDAARNSADIVRRISAMRLAVEETSRGAEQVARSAEGMGTVAKRLQALL